jgi:hypothetical protein
MSSTATAGVDGQDHLNGHSAIIFAVFCIVSFFVIFPIRIPLPHFLSRLLLRVAVKCRIISEAERQEAEGERLHFTLSLLTAPLIGVVLLLATTTINGGTIRLGIVGDENVKPYEVLVLFISLVSITKKCACVEAMLMADHRPTFQSRWTAQAR